MANFNKSPVEQVNSWGASVGLGTSQVAESLGLHDTRPKTLGLSENGIQLDPLSIRITLVIVFVIIFLLVVLVVFLVICLKRHKCIGSSKNRDENVKRLRSTRNRYNTEDDDDFSIPRPRTVSNDSENSFMNDNEDYLHGVSYNSGTADIGLEKVSKKPYEPRAQQPDIIEAEIHFVPSYHLYDYAYDHRIYGPSNDKIKQQIQCDLPKAPDVNCFRVPPQQMCHSPVSYREHQDAEDVKRRNFIHHSLVLRSHLNSPPSTASPSDVSILPTRGNIKTELFQTTPLARLTPSTSSESPKHPVRVLTLQDISRKQLQAEGLIMESSSSGGISKDIMHSHSEVTSWNSPVVSQFSKWSSGPEVSTGSSGVKNAPPGNIHSDGLRNHDIPPPVEPDDCSLTSTDSDDGSFTGSEYIDDDLRHESPMKSRQLERHNEQLNNIESEEAMPSCVLNVETDIFPDAFSKLVSYDDSLAQRSNAQSLNNLEYLLNWGLNFESLMDVFQDLAELPDLEPDGSRIKRNVSSPCEIYV